jgi:hypothetical protein
MIAVNHSLADVLPWSAGMSEIAELLWRINTEYRVRLSRAQNSLDLLGQLLQLRISGEDEGLTETLREMRQALQALADDHREWRYRYFYESADARRMVQDDLSVNRAIAAFSRMHSGQQRVLHQLYDVLDSLPRPDTLLTSVANGDLWRLTRQAFADLASFSDYLQTARR